MKVRVTKQFKFSPDGNRVVDVVPGNIVDGRCAEVALQSGWGEAEDTEAEVVRLPPLEEYVAAGYVASTYNAFITKMVADAEKEGKRAVVLAKPVADPDPELDEESPEFQSELTQPAPVEAKATAPEHSVTTPADVKPAEAPAAQTKPKGKASKNKAK